MHFAPARAVPARVAAAKAAVRALRTISGAIIVDAECRVRVLKSGVQLSEPNAAALRNRQNASAGRVSQLPRFGDETAVAIRGGIWGVKWSEWGVV